MISAEWVAATEIAHAPATSRQGVGASGWARRWGRGGGLRKVARWLEGGRDLGVVAHAV